MYRTKLPPYQRQKGFTGGFYGKRYSVDMMTSTKTPQKLPCGTIPLDNQVAGHTFQPGTDAIGMLKDQNDGDVLKPAGKPKCGERELQFYESLQNPKNPDLIRLQQFVPIFKGAVKMKISGKEVDFIKLSDLTHGMFEPCIMDIKIGKRTWDPLATPEKIAAEEEKYAGCKKTIGLCIPGFQVYSLATGKCRRYGKEYGKKLNEKTFRDTLKLFLNADSGLSRKLLIQILSGLWTIQKWFRMQTSYKFYSSSILIVYDAKRLRSALEANKQMKCNGSNGSISPKTPNSPSNDKPNWGNEQVPNYRKLQRSHSLHNNYDNDLKAIRESYAYMLDSLIGSYDENKPWAYVKMIDFAHAFPSDDDSIDINYLFGIDNLVKVFEEFLKECD